MVPLPASVGGFKRAVCIGATTAAFAVCFDAAAAQEAPPNAPSTSPPQQQTQPPSQPAERRVDIDAYDVDGNTKLDEDTLASTVYPFLGPQRTREDVENARSALEHAYQERGYQSVIVEIPPQTVTNGIVKLHVVEAPIGRLRVVGSSYVLPSFVKGAVPSLAEGQVPNFSAAQRELAALNRLPDRQITPVVKAGEETGTLDVDLRVKDTLPLHASVELNNDHSANTPPLRLLATARYDDLWQLGNSLSFTYLAAPQDVSKSQVFAGSYFAPIYGTPWSLFFSGYTSNSLVNTLGGTGVLGNGFSISARAMMALPQLGDFSQSVSLGVAFNDFLQNVSLTNPTACIQETTTLSSCVTDEYAPISISYSVSRQETDSSLDATLSATFGARGIGSTPREFINACSFATGDFVHVNLDFTVMQALWDDIQAVMHFSGQLADQPLVPTEQFAAGGLTSVRGYLQSEAIGDDGLVDSFEIRSPSVAPYIGSFIDDWRLFVFADLADVGVLDALPSQKSNYQLASTGIGSRLATLGHFSGSVDVAWPLVSGQYTKAFDPVTTFSFKAEF